MVHKITEAMVAEAPTLQDLEQRIIEAVRGKLVVMYNKTFDEKRLTPGILQAMGSSECCMERFAKAHGQKSLISAAMSIGYKWEGPSHRALGDTFACRAVWRYLRDNSPAPTGLASLEDIY